MHEQGKSALLSRDVFAASRNGMTCRLRDTFERAEGCSMHVDRDDPANPPPLDHSDPAQAPPLSQVGNDLIDLPFDRYRLLRVIGEGAMGTVYEARQHEPVVRTIAVKIMKTRHTSAAAEARFTGESRRLATLNHPHVAQLYDAGIHRSGVLTVPFCVMELVGGANSITGFAKAKHLTLRQRIELFLQVCAGVRHVHEHDIIHCDLKPSNILVNEHGQVKVIDFGVARTMQLDASGGTVWSDASVIFGTPQYMSPEQVRGHDLEIGGQSDVYSLGVVLYELLCERVPYKVDRTSAITAARSILEYEPFPPRKIHRSLRGDIEKVLLKALAKEPDRRYASVRALEEDLHRLLQGEPIAPDGRHLYRARRRAERWIARRRLFVTSIALIVVAAVCAFIADAIDEHTIGTKYDLFLTQTIHHTPSAPLQHVVIVKITDRTDLAALAGTRPNDQPGDALHPRFGRRAHGNLLRRLAAAGVRPSTVSFDIHFPPDSPWDRDFVEGIRSFPDTPVVVTAIGNIGDGQPSALIAPQLREHVFTGGVISFLQSDSPWVAKLATTMSNGGIYPSFALMTASQCWQRGATPAMEWMPDALRLHYGATGQTRDVDVTSVSETPIDDPDRGLRKGSPFAEFMIEVPNDADLARSSIDYRDVFELTDEQLRQRLDGRVVLIGDYRPGGDGPFPHPDGRTMPGAVLHAVTIERLLSGDILKRPRYLSGFGSYVTSAAPIVVLASLLGGTVARLRIARRTWSRLLASAVLAAAIVAIALLSFRIGGFVYLPLAPVLCVVVGAEVARLIGRARESTI